MIISKEKLNNLLYKTIVMTCETCGRKLSMTSQAKLKNKIFNEFDDKEENENKKRGSK